MSAKFTLFIVRVSENYLGSARSPLGAPMVGGLVADRGRATRFKTEAEAQAAVAKARQDWLGDVRIEMVRERGAR